MKWLFYGLIVVFVGAVTYQYVVEKKGGLQVSPKSIIMGEMRAPGFEGGEEWINSEALDLRQLMEEKKVILVDFWTYSCINCQRTIPYLKQWWEKYKEKGLVIVGVHSPEFEFEKKKENVTSAVAKYGVGWPVVLDSEMKIWRAYANHYWPAKYLVVPSERGGGKIVYTHFGEGAYEETEKIIRNELVKLGYDLSGMEITEETGEGRRGGVSPETYLGWERGRFGNGEQIGPDVMKEYVIKGGLMGNLAYLSGEWKVNAEFALAGKNAKLKYKFTGGEVNLVLHPGSGNNTVRVLVDGKEIKTVQVKEADLYNLYKGEFVTGEMELFFGEGLEAYAFTFGR